VWYNFNFFEAFFKALHSWSIFCQIGSYFLSALWNLSLSPGFVVSDQPANWQQMDYIRPLPPRSHPMVTDMCSGWQAAFPEPAPLIKDSWGVWFTKMGPLPHQKKRKTTKLYITKVATMASWANWNFFRHSKALTWRWCHLQDAVHSRSLVFAGFWFHGAAMEEK
jgi:hypothetical protein